MKVYWDEKNQPVVSCECGHKFVKDGVIRWRVALIDITRGYICPKCPVCKRFTESFNIKILISREETNGREETTHKKYPEGLSCQFAGSGGRFRCFSESEGIAHNGLHAHTG